MTPLASRLAPGLLAPCLFALAAVAALPAAAQQAPAPSPDLPLNQALDPLPLQFVPTGPMLRDGASVLLDPRDVEGLDFHNPVDESAQTARKLPGVSLVIPFTGPSAKNAPPQ